MKYEITKFRLIDFILIAVFSALVFLVEMFAAIFSQPLGGIFILSLIPGLTSMIILSILDPLLGIFVVFLVKKFGTFTLLTLVLGILSIGSPVVQPIPGILKLLVFVPSGIIGDLIFLFLSKRELLSSTLAAAVAISFSSVMFLSAVILAGLPEVEVVKQGTVIFATFGFIFGGIGGFLGYKVYKKFEKRAFVKRLKSMK